MLKTTLLIQKTEEAIDLPLPVYQTELAAGMDLRSSENRSIGVCEIELIKTGIKIAIPEGYEAQIRPRSGLAAKHGISIVNSPATIDADYRGEIKVILINLGTKPFHVKKGDRIAQMVIAPIARAKVLEVQELDETERGSGGFGHTGI